MVDLGPCHAVDVLRVFAHPLVALCHSDDGASPTVMSSSVLGIRGLASESEVIQFLGEITAKAVVLGRKGGPGQGRPFNGEAFVELDPADAASALEELHLSSFGSRYVECVMAQEKSEPPTPAPHHVPVCGSLIMLNPCTPE